MPDEASECIHGLEQCDVCASPRSQKQGSTGGTMSGQTFELIYAPALASHTFLHLNVQGDSWKIREYPGRDVPFRVIDQAGQRSKRGVVDDLGDIEILHRRSYLHSGTRVGVTVEDTAYWHQEIAKLNAEFDLGR